MSKKLVIVEDNIFRAFSLIDTFIGDDIKIKSVLIRCNNPFSYKKNEAAAIKYFNKKKPNDNNFETLGIELININDWNYGNFFESNDSEETIFLFDFLLKENARSINNLIHISYIKNKIKCDSSKIINDKYFFYSTGASNEEKEILYSIINKDNYIEASLKENHMEIEIKYKDNEKFCKLLAKGVN